jgi:hypothetical protein
VRFRSELIGLAVTIAACVPEGTAPPYDAGPQPALTSTFKPSVNIMATAFEDNFDRPDGGETPLLGDAATTPAAAIDAAVADAGKPGHDAGAADGGLEGGAFGLALDAGPPPRPSNLGPSWTQMKTNAWHIDSWKLCVENAHNHGVWLNRTLPVNARIEYDAFAYTDDGDLKSEVWGDGKSYATGTSYTNATSYLVILGGWHNTLQVLARLNEHGTDRKEIPIVKETDDPRQRAVQRGQLYQFKIERTDGRTLRWSVNGVEYLTWNDPQPLAGQGHDHFGFNEWEAKVCFDNVKVTPL